jgi:hypothetical protein
VIKYKKIKKGTPLARKIFCPNSEIRKHYAQGGRLPPAMYCTDLFSVEDYMLLKDKIMNSLDKKETP